MGRLLQPPYIDGGVGGCGPDMREVLSCLVLEVCVLEEPFGRAEDGRQRVVEVVGHPGGDLTQHTEGSGLRQLVLGLLERSGGPGELGA